MPNNPRDTHKYKVGNRVVHGGITNDLERREREHQQTWPTGHIKQDGRQKKPLGIGNGSAATSGVRND